MSLEKRIKSYESQYIDDYGFEKEMVKARQKYIKELIMAKKPSRILEIGCGLEPLFQQVSDNEFIKNWTIIEPSNIFFTEANKLTTDTRVNAIQGFFEEVIDNQSLKKVDMIICSGLLHEIENPTLILNAAKKILVKNGLLHVNVPNAFSMHRQLAVEMGYIDSVFDFSNRNKELSQYHIYDLKSFKDLLNGCEYEIIDEGGYFIKPFTHFQMEKIMETLNTDILNGLYLLGQKYPELASEIYLNVRI